MKDRESKLGQYKLFVYVGDIIHDFHFFSLSITDQHESGSFIYCLDGIHSEDEVLLDLFRSQEKTDMKIVSSYINENTGEYETSADDIRNAIVNNVQVVGATWEGFGYCPILRVIILHKKGKDNG